MKRCESREVGHPLTLITTEACVGVSGTKVSQPKMHRVHAERSVVGPKRYVGYCRVARVGATASAESQSTIWELAVPAVSFLVSVLVYMVVGFLCMLLPAQATDHFSQHRLAETSTCARVTRHTNFAAVELLVGSPVNLVSLLLRMDEVVGPNETAMRLFSNRVAESDTVSCSGTLCQDVALLHMRGPSSDQVRAVVTFEYQNPTTESLTYGTAVTIDLDGELRLKSGFDYSLTATHFCWTEAVGDLHSGAEPRPGALEGAVPAKIVHGHLHADASGLEQTHSMRSTPAGRAQVDRLCDGGVGDVALFPGAAADEARWLGLTSNRAYETSPDGVDGRRTVVEVGTRCASNNSDYTRAYSLFQLDCLSVYVSCEVNPSVPFRRVAMDQVRLAIPADGSNTAYVFTSPDERLRSLPKLDEGDSAMYIAIVKLGLMTLAAAVTWMRASKTTSAHDQLFLHCLKMVFAAPSQKKVDAFVVWEDGAVGLVAMGARLAVSIWRAVTLAPDGHLRAPVAQLAATALSLVQWFMRYVVLGQKDEAPLTKLGGSTALVDATCAVMMGFAQPPLFVNSISRFDPTARLLTALLITTMTLHRCLFAVACCGFLLSVGVRKPQHGDVVSATCAVLALVAWLLQTASVAVLIADLFCLPLAHSMARSVDGGWVEISMAIFAATTAAGLPQLMQTVSYLAVEHV